MAGAVSALFLLDIKGRVLVWRDYRGDVSALQAERFFTKLIEKEVISSLSPWIRFASPPVVLLALNLDPRFSFRFFVRLVLFFFCSLNFRPAI